ncbi:MAG: hypothetical protein AB1512_15545 [Thermodesulfobacteriota bacterium]
MAKNGVILLVTIILLCGWTQGVHAYTYTYHNKTDHVIRVNVRLYDDADKTAPIEPRGSYAVSTRFLLKSWTVEVYSDNHWLRVLELTCDVLPGDHTFSILVEEVKGSDGKIKRSWQVVNQ